MTDVQLAPGSAQQHEPLQPSRTHTAHPVLYPDPDMVMLLATGFALGVLQRMECRVTLATREVLQQQLTHAQRNRRRWSKGLKDFLARTETVNVSGSDVEQVRAVLLGGKTAVARGMRAEAETLTLVIHQELAKQGRMHVICSNVPEVRAAAERFKSIDVELKSWTLEELLSYVSEHQLAHQKVIKNARKGAEKLGGVGLTWPERQVAFHANAGTTVQGSRGGHRRSSAYQKPAGKPLTTPAR